VTNELLERELRSLRAPEEGDAALRAWQVTAAEFELVEPLPARPRRRRWVALAVAGAVALAALAISPAGATVVRWVGDRFSTPGVKDAKPALVSLPTSGRLLVSSRDGAWVVSSDGSKRLLGPYRDATWSPHGLFVAGVRGSSLVAVDTHGHVHWTLPRMPAPELPSWSPGDGFRVAYLSGSTLRVVAGDGTGDRVLGAGVARVRPAWRPGAGHVLSYATADGSIVTRNADTGRILWRASAPAAALQWSADGKVLMARAPHRLELLDGRSGSALKLLTTGAGLRFTDADISPNGRTIALIRQDGGANRSELYLLNARGRSWNARRAFGGAGTFTAARWSPDGHWLLLTWREANQWLFLRSAPANRLVAVSSIARAFEPDRTGPPTFPSAGGWCCAP
jgi:dipeptidyl aminopeptidase/acylaminoacyl peptidase